MPFPQDPSVTALDNGGYVVSWQSYGQDSSVNGIIAQQYSAQLFGTALGETLADKVGANWLNGQGGNDTLRG